MFPLLNSGEGGIPGGAELGPVDTSKVLVYRVLGCQPKCSLTQFNTGGQ